MTRERLIWRPNTIPLEVWESMSREDQIASWTNQSQPKPPKCPMKQMIALYEDGLIDINEFVHSTVNLAASEEIDEFTLLCPTHLLTELKNYLALYGEDESNWPLTFSRAMYAPWITQEQIQELRRQEQEQIWDNVRLLKKYFSL